MIAQALLKHSGISFLSFLVVIAVAIVSGCTNIPKDNVLKESNVEACPPLLITGSGVCSVQPGVGKYLLVAGKDVTPDKVFDGGGVLVAPDGKITAVGCDAFEKAKGLNPTQIVCPSGVISPGLINAHDHITYNWNPPSIWGSERYDRGNEWRKGTPDQKTITPVPQSGTDLRVGNFQGRDQRDFAAHSQDYALRFQR